MSKIENLPKTIPPREIPFSVKLKGNMTEEEYSGDFVVRVPLTRDMSRMGVELAKLNGGLQFEELDYGTATLNNAIAYLKTYLTEAPKWFYEEDKMDFGQNTLDSNIPIEIFNVAEEKVKAWKDALKGKPSAEKSKK